MSFRRTAKEIGCTRPFVGNVDDHPGSGRPPIADQAAQQHVLTAAQLSDCQTAADTALGFRVSAKTGSGQALELQHSQKQSQAECPHTQVS